MVEGKTNLDFDENFEMMKEHLKTINNEFKKKNSVLTNINFNLKRTRYSPISFNETPNHILSKWIFANTNQSFIKQMWNQPSEVKLFTTPRQLDVIQFTSKEINSFNSISSISSPVEISNEFYIKEKMDYIGLLTENSKKIEETPTEKELCKFQASDIEICLSSLKDMIIEGGSLGRLERISRVIIFHLLNYLNLRIKYINFNSENLNKFNKKVALKESRELDNSKVDQELQEENKDDGEKDHINSTFDNQEKIRDNKNTEEKQSDIENKRFIPFKMKSFISPLNQEEAIEKARDQV